MRPLAIVGDVHSNLSALRCMLSKLESLGRQVIFVGDYINGPGDSAGVLEELSKRREENPRRWVFLSGNHELLLLDYLNGGDFAPFAAVGGVSTVSSYISEIYSDVRSTFAAALDFRHRSFLERLELFYEDEDVLISHSGYDPDRPHDRGVNSIARDGHSAIFTSVGPRPLVVCGHYLQRTRKPFVSDHLICLDTGCGLAGGPLTAVLLPERLFLTAEATN